MEHRIRTSEDFRQVIAAMHSKSFPFRVQVLSGEDRTGAQNRLQRAWLLDVERQLDGWTAEEARGYSKLHFGVPILRNEHAVWKAKYDEIIRPMDYEAKLRLMQEPFDFGVTRIMTVKQKIKYLDAMAAHWSEQGVTLTDPEATA